MKILQYIWQGLWNGVGVEVSFLALYILWRLVHGRVAHKLDAGHWLHEIARYFE